MILWARRAWGNTLKRWKKGRHAPMIRRIVASGMTTNTCCRYARPYGPVEAIADREPGDKNGKRSV